jgi:hypothetical protein
LTWLRRIAPAKRKTNAACLLRAASGQSLALESVRHVGEDGRRQDIKRHGFVCRPEVRKDRLVGVDFCSMRAGRTLLDERRTDG